MTQPPSGDVETAPDAPAPPGRRRFLAVPVLVGTVIGITCIGFVLARLSAQWGAVRDQVADADWWWVGVALVCAAGAMTWIAACWQRVLALLGPSPDRGRTVAWYFAGEIGKYVPGGVWPVLGRGELARRGGVPRHRAYPSVGLSLAALYLAALSLATVLVPLDLAHQSDSPRALALLLLLPLGLLALHPRVLGWARHLLVRFTGRGQDMVIPPWRGTIGLVAVYLPAWLLIWAATWCTARALLPDPPFLRIGVATCLSWVAGFAAVPVPAGAGVREAVFIASSGLPAGLGATIAIGSRLVFLVVDVAGAAISAPWHRSSRAERA
ncbi:MAG TPA: lysylphosphatidylglycerol synthase transmembrane domain-containing protein [Acidimicrobiales bacterium]|nr:lysylphosphatidylglycerol synthase transmembrane domain-containing protein [Acidimicrobiales bacterium]